MEFWGLALGDRHSHGRRWLLPVLEPTFCVIDSASKVFVVELQFGDMHM